MSIQIGENIRSKIINLCHTNVAEYSSLMSGRYQSVRTYRWEEKHQGREMFHPMHKINFGIASSIHKIKIKPIRITICVISVICSRVLMLTVVTMVSKTRWYNCHVL